MALKHESQIVGIVGYVGRGHSCPQCGRKKCVGLMSFCLFSRLFVPSADILQSLSLPSGFVTLSLQWKFKSSRPHFIPSSVRSRGCSSIVSSRGYGGSLLFACHSLRLSQGHPEVRSTALIQLRAEASFLGCEPIVRL